jgi:hypothetical protein
MRRIIAASEAFGAARAELDAAVAAARAAGDTWAVISIALGVSRQAANQRFGQRGQKQATEVAGQEGSCEEGAGEEAGIITAGWAFRCGDAGPEAVGRAGPQ